MLGIKITADKTNQTATDAAFSNLGNHVTRANFRAEAESQERLNVIQARCAARARRFA